jgi:hypothetical protein
MNPPSTIATDPISPHYGHYIVDLDDEGAWWCVTCEPEGPDDKETP